MLTTSLYTKSAHLSIQNSKDFDKKVHKVNEHNLCILLIDCGAHIVYNNKMKEVKK